MYLLCTHCGNRKTFLYKNSTWSTLEGELAVNINFPQDGGPVRLSNDDIMCLRKIDLRCHISIYDQMPADKFILEMENKDRPIMMSSSLMCASCTAPNAPNAPYSTLILNLEGSQNRSYNDKYRVTNDTMSWYRYLIRRTLEKYFTDAEKKLLLLTPDLHPYVLLTVKRQLTGYYKRKQKYIYRS